MGFHVSLGECKLQNLKVSLVLFTLGEVCFVELVVSQIGGAQYRPQNTIVLIMETPKKVPIILETPNCPAKELRHANLNQGGFGFGGSSSKLLLSHKLLTILAEGR